MIDKEECFIGQGFLKTNTVYKWNPDTAQNPHLMIAGASGSGKTRLLRIIIDFLREKGKTIHLVDFHGDIQVKNESVFTFTARNSPYGINPFEFLLDKENGGIKVQAKEIVEMIKKSFMPNMGSFQESVLYKLIIDCYAQFGFIDEDSNTWGFNHNLNTKEGKAKWYNTLQCMEDLYNLIQKIKEISKSGLEPDFSKEIEKHGKKLNEWKNNIEQLNREIHTLVENMNIGNKEDIEKEIKAKKEQKTSIQDTIADKKEKMLEYFDGYIDYTFLGGALPEYQRLTSNDDSFNIDFSYYKDKQVMKTLDNLAIYISSLVESGAFSKKIPAISNGLNRYDLHGLDKKAQTFFCDVLVGKLFKAVKLRGDYSKLNNDYRKKKGDKCDLYVIIDEAKLVMPTGANRESAEHPINRVVAEARKYGFGIILVSQRVKEFPETILSSVSNKIILQTNGNDYATTKKALALKNDKILNILTNNKNVGITNLQGIFEPICLPYHDDLRGNRNI
jgi:energy-coupling factor transporter ATP-binding protein EcfA2